MRINLKYFFFLLLLTLFCVPDKVVAQSDTVRVGEQWAVLMRDPHYKKMNVRMMEDVKHDTVSTWWRRLSLQINAVDVGLTIPNLTIGYDLGDPFVRTTPTLLVSMRNTFRERRWWFCEDAAFDLRAFKVELRRHWVPLKYRQHIIADEPPKASGRFYAGVFAEYMYQCKFDGISLDKIHRKIAMPSGRAFATGMTWGYERKKINYNHRFHFNWDFGLDAGIMYAPKTDLKVFPLVTDLRVALNFRYDRMNFLYWKPDERQFQRNERYNNDLHARIEHCRHLIDSLGSTRIYVTSVEGDSAFQEVLTQSDVLKEISKHLNFKGLKQSDIVQYETSTKFPIQGKELGEYYTLDFRMGMRPTDKFEEQYGTDTIAFSLPFSVRLHGFEEADSLLNRFEENVAKWREEHGGNYPTLKMKHLDREHVAGHATAAQVIELFKEVSGVEIKPEQITGFYYKSDDLHAVKEEEMNLRVKRGTYYSMALKLHPQCELIDGALASRFVLDFNDAEQMQSEYAMLARYFNSGRKISIDRVWTGNDNLLEPITATEIIDAIARDTQDSISFLRPNMIELAEDTVNTIGVHKFSLTYDVMFGKISDRRFYVTDTLGIANSERIHRIINNLGYISYYRDYNYVGYPTIRVEDPSDMSLITPEAVAEVMSKFYGVNIEPYQVSKAIYSDSNNAAVYTQAWQDHPEVFRGMAVIKLHPEYPTNIKFYYKVVKN